MGFCFQYCCFFGNVQGKMKFKDKTGWVFLTLASVVHFFKLLGRVVSFWPAFYLIWFDCLACYLWTSMLAGWRGIFSGNSVGCLLIDFLVKVQNTLPLICMSLNKNSIYCVMLRSSKNADQRKQWWYRVAGYSAVAPLQPFSYDELLMNVTRVIVELAGSLEEKLYYQACMTAHEQFIKCQPLGLTPNTKW